MTADPHFGDLEQAVAALERDLLAADGPQISTMRNYRFAILPYLPSDEFKLRRRILRLTERLRAEGWAVLPISLQKLLLDRVRRTGEGNVQALIARERRLHERDPARALAHIAEKIAPAHRGPRGTGRGRGPRDRRLRRPTPGQCRSLAGADRPGGRALPVLPLVRAAEAPRRQDAQRPGRPALPRRGSATGSTQRPLVYGRAAGRPRLPAHASTREVSDDDPSTSFSAKVTRDIPPVVYFHEQTPEKLAAEVSEYIITGGWPERPSEPPAGCRTASTSST